MPWFPAAFLVAFFSATEAALLKRWFGHKPPLTMAAVPLAYLGPVCACIWLALELSGAAPAPTPTFWRTLVVLAPINGLAMVLHLGAVGMAPLSLTMPFQAFTPVFVILTGRLMLGETVSPAAAAGIGLIVAGSYVLNFAHLRKDALLAPLAAIVRETGSRWMLGAALLYALCAVLGKKMVLETDPVYMSAVFWTITSACVLAGLRLTGKVRLAELYQRPGTGFLASLAMGAHFFTHAYAVTLTATANMIAIKRLNGLISVAYGKFLFGETDLRNRAAGSLIMAMGALVLSLWG